MHMYFLDAFTLKRKKKRKIEMQIFNTSLINLKCSLFFLYINVRSLYHLQLFLMLKYDFEKAWKQFVVYRINFPSFFQLCIRFLLQNQQQKKFFKTYELKHISISSYLSIYNKMPHQYIDQFSTDITTLKIRIQTLTL